MKTPPLPVTNILDDILLSSVEGIGARTYQLLRQRFGSSTAILDASRNDLSGFDFLEARTLDRLLSARQGLNPQAIVDHCQHRGIDIIAWDDARYPEPLRTIHDPPPILYVRGTMLPQDVFSLAVIGTRRLTDYGRRQAKRLGGALAKSGFTIISGLARGIDTVAHRAALDSGGRTLAVLGGGHDRLYPPENEPLAEEIIAAGGAVLSEYPPLHPSARWTFPQRNRIVSGLSLAVLVIEAPVKSGAMISARMAGEQGRDIFAVPGPIDSDASGGCHQLIRDGAYLVDSVDDVLNVLGPMEKAVLLPGLEDAVRHPSETVLNDIEREVLRHIVGSAVSLDALLERTGLGRHQVLVALAVLEEKRMIRRLNTGRIIRL